MAASVQTSFPDARERQRELCQGNVLARVQADSSVRARTEERVSASIAIAGLPGPLCQSIRSQHAGGSVPGTLRCVPPRGFARLWIVRALTSRDADLRRAGDRRHLVISMLGAAVTGRGKSGTVVSCAIFYSVVVPAS